MFLRYIVECEPSVAEQQAWAATQAHRSGATPGLTATYQLVWFCLDARRARHRRDDVLIVVTDDNE